jgi:hypothetical protein
MTCYGEMISSCRDQAGLAKGRHDGKNTNEAATGKGGALGRGFAGKFAPPQSTKDN